MFFIVARGWWGARAKFRWCENGLTFWKVCKARKRLKIAGLYNRIKNSKFLFPYLLFTIFYDPVNHSLYKDNSWKPAYFISEIKQFQTFVTGTRPWGQFPVRNVLITYPVYCVKNGSEISMLMTMIMMYPLPVTPCIFGVQRIAVWIVL